MTKHKFVREYPFKASPKIIYPYLSSPGGLEEWFAKKVTVDSDHIYTFNWDNADYFAVQSSHRVNKHCKFDFIKGENEGNYIEFKLDISELDGSTFLKISDYSDNDDEEDLEYLWDEMIDKLREIVGG